MDSDKITQLVTQTHESELLYNRGLMPEEVGYIVRAVDEYFTGDSVERDSYTQNDRDSILATTAYQQGIAEGIARHRKLSTKETK